MLGAPAADGAFAQWKIFVKANGIDASKVTIENVGFPGARADARRRPGRRHHRLLVLLYYQPESRRACKPEDIIVMLMADYGVNLYGNAIMVNPNSPRPIRRR